MSKPVQVGLTIAISMLAFGVHLFWYIWMVPYHLWQWSGGIEQQGIWTCYGLSRWAWTIPLHLPTGWLLHWAIVFGQDGRPNGLFGFLAMVFLLGASLLAAMAAGFFLAGLLARQRPLFGRRWWRLWLFLAGWLWFPFPARLCWIYYWTVAY